MSVQRMTGDRLATNHWHSLDSRPSLLNVVTESPMVFRDYFLRFEAVEVVYPHVGHVRGR